MVSLEGYSELVDAVLLVGVPPGLRCMMLTECRRVSDLVVGRTVEARLLSTDILDLIGAVGGLPPPSLTSNGSPGGGTNARRSRTNSPSGISERRRSSGGGVCGRRVCVSSLWLFDARLRGLAVGLPPVFSSLPLWAILAPICTGLATGISEPLNWLRGGG